jgi:hypothetical protein
VVSILKWLSGAHTAESPEVLALFIQFCHKLAGVAESYGFVSLSRIAGELEDWLGGDPRPDARLLLRSLQLLDEALVSAQVEREDAPRFLADPRAAELTSVAGSIRAGSTPGSS